MDRPPRIANRITSAPKIREFFWCDFWKDPHLPEMWKTRPVLILSYRNTLSSICTVIPISTSEDNAQDKWSYELPIQLEEGRTSWAVCNQPTSVAISRLTAFKAVPRLSEAQFNPLLAKVLEWLPKVP